MNLTPLTVGGLMLLTAVLGYWLKQFLAAKQTSSKEQKALSKIEAAENEAKKIVLEAKDKAAAIQEETKKEQREKEAQISRLEERLLKREDLIDKKDVDLKQRQDQLEKETNLFQETKKEVEELKGRIVQDLEKIAGLDKETAKAKLFKDIEEMYREDLIAHIQKLEKEKREEVEKKSLDIILPALQRYSRSHVSEFTTTTITLPSDELKGKIIGREGRNIKTLERLTGVEVIIDETPETIIISSFDPLRREIAKMALEKLIKDGRIQPAKIEEKVEESRQELDKRIQEIGESAAYELGILDLPKEITYLLGRLNYRTSFGQNVLTHSIEMAYVAAMIATELGLNVEVTKKAALLHDIGKAIDHETEGTHVELGRKILKKYGIDEEIIKGMQSHHEEYPFANPESFVITAVDVLSAARPGARRGTVENYIRRLEDLEKIANSFDGVKSSYAISAGREIRVFVTPEKIDDFGALRLAKDIATKIQSEMKYPGEIKVNVIREIKAVEYAR